MPRTKLGLYTPFTLSLSMNASRISLLCRSEMSANWCLQHMKSVGLLHGTANLLSKLVI